MVNNATILVVDDEPDILALVGELLEDDGYTVILLTDPRDVMAIDDACRPVLFMFDLMLPAMSGMELAHLLRQERFPETPMIAMSASGGMLASAAATKLFQATLAKPFNLSQLLDCASYYAGAA